MSCFPLNASMKTELCNPANPLGMKLTITLYSAANLLSYDNDKDIKARFPVVQLIYTETISLELGGSLR